MTGPKMNPTAANATGTGDADDRGVSTPPPADESASTTGLGAMDSQKGNAPDSAEAPYDLDGQEANPDEPRSPSGT